MGESCGEAQGSNRGAGGPFKTQAWLVIISLKLGVNRNINAYHSVVSFIGKGANSSYTNSQGKVG